MADEKFLRDSGIDPTTPADPHGECTRRWLDEREKRERAEESIVKNAQAYEVLSEKREAQIEKWRQRALLLAVVAFAVFAASVFVLLVRR